MLFKNIIVVDLIVVPYEAEFSVVGFNELENNPVGNINAN